MSRSNSRLASGLVIFVSCAIGYGISELGYRVLAAKRSRNFFTTDRVLYDFDPRVGYKYRPGAPVSLQLIDASNRVLQRALIHVNNHGHISLSDDEITKSPDEYRIAVLGDSFTACLANAMGWPDRLERALSTDASWKVAIGRRRVKVINFGMDGTGIAQWPKAYDYEVAPYHPDLLVINFITDDLIRRFMWRESVPISGIPPNSSAIIACTSLPATIANADCAYVNGLTLAAGAGAAGFLDARSRILSRQLSRLPWTSIYPFLLSRIVGARFWGAFVGSARSFSNAEFRYADDEGVIVSVTALRSLRARTPNVLLVHNPVASELEGRHVPEILHRLQNAAPDLQIVETMALFPPSKSQEALYFNPNDDHFSDFGTVAYANIIRGVIRSAWLRTTGSFRRVLLSETSEGAGRSLARPTSSLPNRADK